MTKIQTHGHQLLSSWAMFQFRPMYWRYASSNCGPQVDLVYPWSIDNYFLRPHFFWPLYQKSLCFFELHWTCSIQSFQMRICDVTQESFLSNAGIFPSQPNKNEAFCTCCHSGIVLCSLQYWSDWSVTSLGNGVGLSHLSWLFLDVRNLSLRSQKNKTTT